MAWDKFDSTQFETVEEALALDALHTEVVEAMRYPKNPVQVGQRFQRVANALTHDIEKNYSSDRSLRDERKDIRISLAPNQQDYLYTVTSYGIATTIKFFPEFKPWKPEAWRISLYFDGIEYHSKNINSLSDESAIKTILWYANSANKDFYRCKDYNFLRELPLLIKNPANKKYFKKYKERFDKIMKIEKFYKLEFDNTIEVSTSWPWLWFWPAQHEYMNMRRKAIKDTVKKQISSTAKKSTKKTS